MDEWLKILISAVTGMVAGALLDPIKFEVNLYFTTKRARKRLLWELAGIYRHFILMDLKPADLLSKLELCKTEEWDYFSSAHPAVIQLGKKMVGIRRVYYLFETLREKILKGTVSTHEGCQEIKTLFEIALEEKYLDKEEFLVWLKKIDSTISQIPAPKYLVKGSSE